MRLLVQMDPIETMLVERDTSLAFMLEAQKRGWEIWWTTPQRVVFDTDAVVAEVARVEVRDRAGDHFTEHDRRREPLSAFDVVMIRQDPPFDMAYVANTYLLELLPPSTLVLNDPRGVRDLSEKIATLRFPDLIAPTFVGRDPAAIAAFAARHEVVVLKPSFFMGGEGVRKARADDEGFSALVTAMLAETAPEPIVVQAFLPGVKNGDKRLFLVEGEPVGAVRRLPKAGEFRANLHVGGQAAPGEVDARDREIAARVAPLLAERGILFAGLDVIDGRLTEINVTSPTLVRQLTQFGGPDVAAMVWDAIERRLKARAANL